MEVSLSGPSFASQRVLWAEEIVRLDTPTKARVRAVLMQEVAQGDMLGTNAALIFVRSDGTSRRFDGWVTEVNLIASPEAEDGTRGAPTYEFCLVATMGLLSGSIDCRIFQEKKTDEIVTEVLGEFGLKPDQLHFELSHALTPRVYSVQYRESALHYVSRLLEEDGILYYSLIDENGQEHVYFADDSTQAEKLPESAVPLRRASGQVEEGSAVYERTAARSVRAGRLTVTSFDFENPSLSLEASAEAADFASLESYRTTEVYTKPERGKRLAQIRLEEEQARGDRVSFVTDALETHVGHGFDLEELDGETTSYFVTAVTHEYSHDPGTSLSSTSQHGYRALVEGVPLTRPYRPRRLHARPVIAGPQTAIVVGQPGAESETLDTDKYGRVQVQFHWDRRGNHTTGASCWVRVAQLQTSGSMVLPRVDWEVVVEFIDGDPDQPIVTGRLFNGRFGPPYQLPEGKTRTSLQSASSPGGGGRNEIRFEDAAGSEEMMVNSQYNTLVAAANNRKKNITRNETQTIGNNAQLEVGGDQSLTITGGYETTVTGAHDTKVDGNRKMEVNAVYGLTTTGASKTTIGGNWMSMVGSPLDALIALGVSKAADVISAQADKAFQAVSAQAQGAIDQAMGAVAGLTSQTDAIQEGMDAMANGKMAASAGVLGGAAALPGAGDMLNSLAQGPASARAAEGTEASSGGIALAGAIRAATTGKLMEAQKTARTAMGEALGASGDAMAVSSEANATGPVGDQSGFSAEDTATGPGYSQFKVESSHTEKILGSRLQVAVEPVQVNVKTSMSETVGAAHVEVVGGTRAESCEGASSETEPGLVIVAKGGENLTVHGACQISVGGAIQESVNGDYSIESPLAVLMVGSMCDLKAKGKITLKVGASSLVVDGSGVTIQSPIVNISGSAVTATQSVSDG